MDIFKNLKNAMRAYDETYMENEDAPRAEAPAFEVEEEYAEVKPKAGFFLKREPRYAPEPEPVRQDDPFFKITPTSINDAKIIADQLRSRTVMINFEGVDEQIGHDIFCYLNGFIYATGGKATRISKSVYAFTPAGVGIGSDDAPAFENSGFSF